MMGRIYRRMMQLFLVSPFFHAVSAVFCLLSAFSFFFLNRFFAFQTVDVRRFFLVVPYLSVVFIPFTVTVPRLADEMELPFPDTDLVLAKFLSCMTAVFFPFVLSLSSMMAATMFGNVEPSRFATSFFGTMLFFSSVSSASVFISFRFRSRMQSFLVSFALLLVFCSVHEIPLYLETPEIASGVLKFFSLAWHFSCFSKGIISLSDLIFFVNATFFFLGLSVITIQKYRGNNTKKYFAFKKYFYASSTLVFLFSAVFDFRIDATSSRQFSLSSSSRELLREVQEPLSVTYYVSPKLRNYYPQVDDVAAFLESYAAESASVSFCLKNPSRSGGVKRLEKLGVHGQPIQTAGNGSKTYTDVYSSIVLEYLGSTKVIPFVLNPSRLEYDMDVKIRELLDDRMMNVQVLVGNDLDLGTDYSYVELFLLSQGFSPVQTYTPSFAASFPDGMFRPFTDFRDVPLVVLGTGSFTAQDLADLEEFILGGGRVFLASQPYAVDIKSDWRVNEPDASLFPRTMFTFGIYLRETLTCDESCFTLTMVSDKKSSGTAANSERIDYPLWPVIAKQSASKKGMTLFWPCAFDIDNEVAALENLETKPLLVTGRNSWQLEKSGGVFMTNPFDFKNIPGPGDEKGPFAVAAEVFRKGETSPSLVFLSDQYAFATQMLSYSSSAAFDTRSLDFLSDSLLRLSGREGLHEAKNKSYDDSSFFKVDASDFRSRFALSMILSFIVPVVLIFAIFLYTVQKRRRFNS